MHSGSGLPFRTALILALAALTGFGLKTAAQDGVDGGTPEISRPPATTSDPNIPETTQRIRVQSLLVTTPVTVVDSSGQLVYGLDQKDFQVFDDGVQQRIERFDVANEPIVAVVVVQTNQTVAPLLDQVRPVGPVLSSLMLGPNGRAAVISFADKVNLLQNFSNSSDELAKTLTSLEPWGTKERLNDALSQAISLLEKQPKSERRIIIAFSDGFDNGSETTKQEIVRRATGAEVTIYGLGFNPAEALIKSKPDDLPMSPLDANVARPAPPGMPATPTIEQQVYDTPIDGGAIGKAIDQTARSTLSRTPLADYAAYTGGVCYKHWSKNSLQNQLGEISTEVRNQYELAYVPDTLNQTGFHRIEIRVAEPGMKVRTRAGYFYAPKSAETGARLPGLAPPDASRPHLRP